MDVPFNQPDLGEAEIEAVTRALRQGHLGGNGPICKRVQERLSEITGARHVLLTPSATLAQDLAMLGLGIGAGDEVLMPGFAYVSQANSILARGAIPIFCDVDPATLNLDPGDAERRIGPRTRAVLPVHYAGVAADLDALSKLCEKHGLLLLEDAAQGLGAHHEGRHLGTLGDAGFLSFHETKNVVCGEGGALLLDSDALMERLELAHEKGTNRSAFLRGEVDKYTWVELGGSFVLSDLLAALLEAQLSRFEALEEARLAIWERYHQELAPLEDEGLLRRPAVPAGARHNGHLYGFRTPTPALRGRLLDGLRSAGIGATFHFQPLHRSPFARERLGLDESLPVTEEAAATLVRLPLWPGMRPAQVDRVVEEVTRQVRELAAGERSA